MAKSWDDPKDPQEILDYVVDWAKPLAGDLIVASTWTLPQGITDTGNQSFDDTTTTIWLSGGSDGENYELINQITTAAGRVREQTCRLRCRTK
jgi:hypothetical protein